MNLEDPLVDDKIWARGGKRGKGINAEDVEALVKYAWSPQQKLYTSPPSKGGGFNYAGMAHPEYFNRQYFAKSVYPPLTSREERRNDWYGSDVVPERDSEVDGKHLLLSWTSPLHGGEGKDDTTGIEYEIQLAMVEFDGIPIRTTTTTGDGDALRSFLGPVTKGKTRLGGWDLSCKAMVFLGIVAVGAFAL